MDVSRGQLFCAACDDYVYSTEFDAAIAVGPVGIFAGLCANSGQL